MVGRIGDRLQLDAPGRSSMETDRPTRPITLAVAIPKGDRLDWMVQKVTELGVDRLVLLHAARSTTRWDDARAATQLRSAAADLASRRAGRAGGCGASRSTVRCPRARRAAGLPWSPSRAVVRLDVRRHLIAIGPEGGWSDDELAAARDRVSLGPNILRVETAAVAATALCVIASTTDGVYKSLTVR